jgi:hypothetical protein
MTRSSQAIPIPGSSASRDSHTGQDNDPVAMEQSNNLKAEGVDIQGGQQSTNEQSGHKIGRLLTSAGL